MKIMAILWCWAMLAVAPCLAQADEPDQPERASPDGGSPEAASASGDAAGNSSAPPAAPPAARPATPPPAPPAPTPSSGDAAGELDEEGYTSKKFGKLRILVPPLLTNGHAEHGYSSHRLLVHNADRVGHRVGLVWKGAGAKDFYLAEVSQRKQVPAGGRSWFSLRHPRVYAAPQEVEVWVDGKRVGQLRLERTASALQGGANKVEVLLGRRVPRNVVNQLVRSLRQFKRYNLSTRAKVMYHFRRRVHRYRYRTHWRLLYRAGRWRRFGTAPTAPTPPQLSQEQRRLLAQAIPLFVGEQFAWQRAALPTRQWDRHWLSYSRFDGIILTPGEWTALAPSARVALRRYVEAGGVLVMTGTWMPPIGWLPTSAGSQWRKFAPGFGVCLVYLGDEALGERKDATLFGPVLRAFYEGFLPWRSVETPAGANGTFPIVADIKIPARGIFALMLLFVLLIGPFNFWLLGRLERRLWTLWTVPLVAFVTCLMLFLYAMFSEGWSGHARLLSLTVLDQGNKRASTLGWVGFYHPLTSSDGLRFDPATELSPQFEGASAQRALSIDWSEGQRLHKGWSLSRIPLHFRFRRSERRQERLVLTPQGAALQVLNGLGASVARLWLLDEKGRRFTTDKLEAGARRLLKPLAVLEGSGLMRMANLRSIYRANWLTQLQGISKNPWRYLRRGHYLAEIKAAPFADPAVKQSANLRATTMVYGILEPSHGG